MNKYILILITLVPSVSMSYEFTNNDELLSSVNTNEYLYFTDEADAGKFETLTYIISKDKKKKDLELVSMLMYFSEIIGKKNGATFITHSFNKRYASLIEQAHCTGKINPKRLPSLLYYIKSTNKCYVIPYKDNHELTEIFHELSLVLKEAKNNNKHQQEIYKLKLIKTIRYLSEKYDIPPDVTSSLTDLFKGAFSKIFN